MILPIISSILESIFPGANINILPIDKIQIADSITFHFHFDPRDASKSTAIITPHSDNSKDSIGNSSTMLLVKEADQHSKQFELTPCDLPFNSGSHLIINQPVWWDVPSKDIPVSKQLLVCPMVSGVTRVIIETSRGREFEARLDRDGELTVNLWSEDKLQLPAQSRNQVQSAEASEWTFKRYSPNRILTFQETALSHLIFSFDRRIVKEAILIKRVRLQSIHLPNEYYLLVLKK